MFGPVEVLTDTHHPADLPTTGQTYPLAASPLVYPGQTVRATGGAAVPTIRCCLIVKSYDCNGHIAKICGPSLLRLRVGRKNNLKWTIPETESFQPIHTIGIELYCSRTTTDTVWLDHLR